MAEKINIKSKMADEIKLETMKIMASVTSISTKLQNMLLIFISHSKTWENLLLQSHIKKGIIVLLFGQSYQSIYEKIKQ